MTRDEVVAEARTWLGTPYRDRGMIKGVAADCALFPFAVYKAAGAIPADIEPPVYTSSWMMHRDEETYLEWVRRFAREVDREQVGPGDFAIWKYGRTYSHGAIVIDLPEVIHAVLLGRAVITANIDREFELAKRPVRFFTVF